MRRLIIVFLFLCLGCVSAQPKLFIAPKKPAKHIVTLAPNLTEIIFAIGAGNHLVGLSSSSNYPLAAKKIPVIATYSDLDIEQLLMLHPDLVVAWKEGGSAIERDKIRSLHLPLYVASFRQLSDIKKVVRDLGALTGKQAQAAKLIAQFNRRYMQLKKKYSNKTSVSVFYQVSAAPLMTLNNKTVVSQVIKLCGGKNIFGHTINVAPQVSIENILKMNPKIIFVSGQLSDQKNILAFWQRYAKLTAVKKHHIYFTDPNLVERYGPRTMEGAQKICQLINRAR